MQSIITYFQSWPLWALILSMAFVWVCGLWIVKKMFFSLFRRLSQKNQHFLDHALFQSLDMPLNLLIIASLLIVFKRVFADIESLQGVSQYFWIVFKVLGISAMTLFFDRLIRGVIIEITPRIAALKIIGGALQVIARVIVFAIGVLMVLDALGISVMPLMASLGIGSLAVALALQPTLENFFSGMQIIADKPLAVGQLIKLESGEEGTVHRIGWRSTWLVLSNNNMMIIPNKLLVNSRIVNYVLPNTETVVALDIVIDRNSDLSTVERVTKQVALEVAKTIPGGVQNFDPIIRFVAFHPSGIEMKVILRAQTVPSSHHLRHAFIKTLKESYQKEGIVIPYPTQSIHLMKG